MAAPDFDTLQPVAPDFGSLRPVVPDFGTLRPETDDEFVARIDSDPSYPVSLQEFTRYQAAKAARPMTLKRVWEAGKAGLQGFGEMVANLADAAMSTPEERAKRRATPVLERTGNDLQTLLEASARGTTGTAMLFSSLKDKLDSWFTDYDPESYAIKHKLTYVPDDAWGRSRVRDLLVWGGKSPKEADEQMARDIEATKDTMRQYRQYKTERDWTRFKLNRGMNAARADALSGQQNLLPEWLGTVDQETAEALSPFLDVSNLATLGVGMMQQQAAKGAARGAAVGALKGAGAGATRAGQAVSALAEMPANAVKQAVTAATGSAEAGSAAAKAVTTGSVGLTVAGVGGVEVPGASQLARGIIAGKAIGGTATQAGEALSAVGRSLAAGPSRWGPLQRIADDVKAPTWVRTAAQRAILLDPAIRASLDAGGTVGRAALAGAGVGGGLAALGGLGDPELIGQGIGSGIGFGALGGAQHYALGGGARARVRNQADLARFLAKQDGPSLERLGKLGASPERLLQYADLELMFPELRLHYRTGPELDALEPGAGKVRGFVRKGDRDIYVNVDYGDPSALFHEWLHASEGLEFGAAEMARLNRVLFDQVAPDGQVVTRGVYSLADQQAFMERYLAAAKGTRVEADWRALKARSDTADAAALAELQSRVQGEMRAEESRRWLTGSTEAMLPGLGGAVARARDAVLLADRVSWLGRARRALERAGVQFDSAGEPTTYLEGLGQQRGRAVVDAALRDYVRARRRVVGQLVETDGEAPRATIDPAVLIGNAWVAEHYDGLDIWDRDTSGAIRRMPDGSPRLRTNSEVLKALAARAAWIDTEFGKLAASAEPGAFRRRENGQWSGQFLTDAQVARIQAANPQEFPPSLKAKVAWLNDLLKRNAASPELGEALLMDYNAALAENRAGARRYAGLSPMPRIGVPYELYMSKVERGRGGNFLIKTLDLTALWSKLDRWSAREPAALAPWGGDREAMGRDVLTVLRNKVKGQPAALDLDANPQRAIAKRNAILDLLNFNSNLEEPVSTTRQADRILRDRRLDRINRLTSTQARAPFSLEAYYRLKDLYRGDPIQALPGGEEGGRSGGMPDESRKNLQTIYRAGSAGETGVRPWSSWSRSLGTARAYLDNPGFGGDTLRSEQVPVNRILRADVLSSRGMGDLAEALGFPRDQGVEWWSNGWRYPWEESPAVKEALEKSSYDWLEYTDDFPQGAETLIPLREVPLDKPAAPEESPGASGDVKAYRELAPDAAPLSPEAAALRARGLPAGERGELGPGAAQALPGGDVERWIRDAFQGNPLVKAVYSPRDIERFASALRTTSAILGPDPETVAAVMPPETPLSPLRSNSDRLFKLTFDLSTICPRQDLHTGICQALEQQGGKLLSQRERFQVGRMLTEAGYAPSCWYCFGQGGRDKFDAMVDRTVSAINTTQRLGKWEPRQVALEAGGGFSPSASVRDLAGKWAGRLQGPADAVAVREILAGRRKPAGPDEAALAEDVRGYAQAARFANQPKGYAPYWQQILMHARGQIPEFNKSAGLRLNSQTDLRMWHILDMSAMLAHLQAAGGMAQIYTRVPEFVEIFGRTGIKINQSVDWSNPATLPQADALRPLTRAEYRSLRREHGAPLWDDMAGMPRRVAVANRGRSPDVGTMLVGLNDYQMWSALDDPQIDMMIPYHRGQVPKEVAQSMGARDYTSEQHEVWPSDWKAGESRTRRLSNGKVVTLEMGSSGGKRVAPMLTREHHGNSLAQYKELAQKFEFEPRYARFIDHPNYMKLVRDVARNPSAQRVVDARKIDWAAAGRHLSAWVKEGAKDAGAPPDPRALRYVRQRIANGDWPELTGKVQALPAPAGGAAAEVLRVGREQAAWDFGRSLPGYEHMGEALARPLLEQDQDVADKLRDLLPSERQSVLEAARSGGMDAATLRLRSLLGL